jgi:hypothetical protein
MQAFPRTMMIEERLGISVGHSDVVAMVEHYLTKLEGPRNAQPKRSAPRSRR